MDRRGKAEGRRQARLDAVPAPAAILAAIHAAVVLLVKAIGLPGRHDEAMHALAVFRVVLSGRQEVGPGAAVARFPRLAAIGGVEHAGRGDGDPELPRVARMGDERMQDEPAAARRPFRPRWVVAQSGDMPPRAAAIVAAEE